MSLLKLEPITIDLDNNVIKNKDISLYMDALPVDFCELMIKQFYMGFKFGEVKDGHVSAQGVAEYRSDKHLVSKDIHLYEHERWDKLNTRLHKNYLIPIVEHYLSGYKHVNMEDSRIDPKGCIFSLYEKSKGHFAPHQDSIGGLDINRCVTVIAYFNDVTLGGETQFFNQSFNIAPRRGMVALFPSNFVYAHKGGVPVSGNKYITVSFVDVSIK